MGAQHFERKANAKFIAQRSELLQHLKYIFARVAAELYKRKWEPAYKPGSVLNDHSSRMRVATHLQQPTRGPCGPQVWTKPLAPLFWSCSGWGLPCHYCYQQRGVLLPHHFTLTIQRRTVAFGGIFSAALSVGLRLPGVTWHPALWSPDFPLSLAGQRSFGRSQAQR